mgnify:CR=1 FL=1
MQQTFVTKLHDPEIKDNTFRPKGPQGKFEWLSTVDINKVMEQYHHSHPDFKFLGAVPIDFDDLPVLGIKKIDFSVRTDTRSVTRNTTRFCRLVRSYQF